MRYIIGTLTLIAISQLGLSAQMLERQVFNSFGSVMSAGGYTLAVNAGEPLTRDYFMLAQNRILTEGFLQPETKDMTVGIQENTATVEGVSIWPNPTAEGLTVSFASAGSEYRTAAVYDMAGKCLMLETLCSGCNAHYLPLTNLADGMYVLRIAFNGTRFREFKFIKVTQ